MACGALRSMVLTGDAAAMGASAPNSTVCTQCGVPDFSVCLYTLVHCRCHSKNG